MVVAQVAEIGLGYRVEVDINDLVEVAGDNLGHRLELVVVEDAVFYEGWQANGCKVAHSYLLRRRDSTISVHSLLYLIVSRFC